jgi:hypothetical protein
VIALVTLGVMGVAILSSRIDSLRDRAPAGPTPPFTLSTRAITEPGYPEGWVCVVASDGSFQVAAPPPAPLELIPIEDRYWAIRFSGGPPYCMLRVYLSDSALRSTTLLKDSLIGWAETAGSAGHPQRVEVEDVTAWRIPVRSTGGGGGMFEVVVRGSRQYELTFLGVIDRDAAVMAAGRAYLDSLTFSA